MKINEQFFPTIVLVTFLVTIALAYLLGLQPSHQKRKGSGNQGRRSVPAFVLAAEGMHGS